MISQTPRPFVCTFADCDKSFVRQIHLTDHHQNVHVEGNKYKYKPKLVEVYCEVKTRVVHNTFKKKTFCFYVGLHEDVHAKVSSRPSYEECSSHHFHKEE